MFAPLAGMEVQAISVEGSLADKDVIGGTAPRQVAGQLERWKERLK